MIPLERLDPELVLLTPHSRREYTRSVVMIWVLFAVTSAGFAHFFRSELNRYLFGQLVLLLVFFYLLYVFLFFRKIYFARNSQVLYYDWSVRKVEFFALAACSLFIFIGFFLEYPALQDDRFMTHFLSHAACTLGLLYMASFFVQKFAIHEDGIYHGREFYRWDWIMKVRWAGENRNLLSLTVKIGEDKWGDDLGTQWLIPAEKVAEIRRLLESHAVPQEGMTAIMNFEC